MQTIEILERMEEMYKAGNNDARPTEPSYNAGEISCHFIIYKIQI